jgi:hydroxymethylpyrimidine kinase / phosphomethylpyrimidine kinase / thiamine-phosphate diphosphorylase
MKLAWSIAGSDPSGAAGSQVDQRTFSALGVHACSVITAITAQDFSNWHGATSIDGTMLIKQISALSQSSMPPPLAIKIGMLGTPEIVHIVHDQLAKMESFVILDPILRASSGGVLNGPDTTEALIKYLFPRVDLLTPNVPESEHLSGYRINQPKDIPEAAAKLLSKGVKRVLIKGGHLSGNFAHDYYADANTSYWLTNNRHSHGARGTGCALASAIAAYLTLGQSLEDSLVAAKAFVSYGIRTARPTELGSYLLDWQQPLPTSIDMPWRSTHLRQAEERYEFPSCGPTPIGFYPIVDRFAWVKRLVESGTTTVQLRIKDLVGEDLNSEIASAITYCKTRNVRLFINDYWQLAIELGAYGVHLGQEDLSITDINAIAKSGLRLGISTHSYAEAAVAHALSPSYVALGPIFETTCKSLRFGPHGLERISEWHRLLPYQLVAIGGLKAEHAPIAMRLGADGVAVISDVVEADNPDEKISLWLRNCIKKTRN